MIDRVTIILKKKQISKHEFDKYTYIITKLNNYLITEIEKLNLHGRDFKNNSTYLSEHRTDLSPEGITTFIHPNLDLVSFGFLKEIPPSNMWNQISNFERTDAYYFFYENIF